MSLTLTTVTWAILSVSSCLVLLGGFAVKGSQQWWCRLRHNIYNIHAEAASTLGMASMDLRALRYFVHVAEVRSFSKAAVQLRVAQPALSRQVRKLEDELGVELLERTGHPIALTEAGTLLLQRA